MKTSEWMTGPNSDFKINEKIGQTDKPGIFWKMPNYVINVVTDS